MSGPDWLTARPIAHRGLHDSNRSIWENTLSAFDAAAISGFAIECDVRLAADGVPVVFHDAGLSRLTGQNGFMHEATSAELAALKVGSTADRIPTLDALLETVAGRVPLVIELKGQPGHDDDLVAAVGRRLAGYRGDAAIMSFDHWLVRRFARHAPDVLAGLTAEGSDEEAMERHFSMLAHDVAFASYSVDEVPNLFTTFMRGTLGRPVITWTVRTPGQVANSRAHADQMTFEGFDPDEKR